MKRAFVAAFFSTAVLHAGWSDRSPAPINGFDNPGAPNVHYNSGGRRIVRVNGNLIALAPTGSGGDRTYRSIDNGLTWTQIDTDGSYSGCLTTGPNGVVYHVYRSGSSIRLVRFNADAPTPLPAPMTVYTAARVNASGVPDEYRMINAVVDRDGTIFIAAHWDPEPEPNQTPETTFRDRIYLLRSTDGGDSWQGPEQISTTDDSRLWTYVHVEANTDNVLMATYRDWRSGGVMLSRLNGPGGTWTHTNISAATMDINNPVLLTVGGSTVVVAAQTTTSEPAAERGVFYRKSTDGGDTFGPWTTVELTCGYGDPSLALAANGDIHIAFRSDNYPGASGATCGDRSREKLGVIRPDGSVEIVDSHIFHPSTGDIVPPTGTRSQLRYQTWWNYGGPIEWTWMQRETISQYPIFHDVNNDVSIAAHPVETPPPGGPTDMAALFRSGQVFLTWTEDPAAESYNVYRVASGSVSPSDIRPENRVVNIPRDFSDNGIMRDLSEDNSPYGQSGWPRLDPPCTFSRNVLAPLDPAQSGSAVPVDDDTNMVVLTSKRAGTFSYAVVSVTGGRETVRVNAETVAGPVVESVQDPEPLLIWQGNARTARMYLQYTDLETVNSTAYAWPTWVGTRPTPPSDNSAVMELRLMGGDQHMRGAENSVSDYEFLDRNVRIKVMPTEDWQLWYGHSGTHRGPPDSVPASGPVVNFTQARIMDFLKWMIQRSPDYRDQIDPERVVARGASNGGFGCLQFSFNYPDFFAFSECSVPPTNILAANYGGGSYNKFFGAPNDPDVTASFTGWRSEPLNTAFSGTTMTDWLNLEKMVLEHPERGLPWIHVVHGGRDGDISWPRFGKNYYTGLNAARHAFSGGLDGTESGDHTNASIDRPPQLRTLRRNNSFPAVSNAARNAPLPLPDAPESRKYELNSHILWSTPYYRVGGVQTLLDEPDRYEIVLASSKGDDVADVTPRRLQRFRMEPGRTYLMRNVAVNNPNTIYQTLSAQPDAQGLLTFRGFQIRAGDQTSGGSRLVIVPEDGGGAVAARPRRLRIR
jgi:hypothetical protein